ncbi:MAG: heparin lyase I family protein [Planctomycetota bacterium]
MYAKHWIVVAAVTVAPWGGGVARGEGREITHRHSPQTEIATEQIVVDGVFVPVGSSPKKTKLIRDDVNTRGGDVVYRFEADADANRIELAECFGTPQNLAGLTETRLERLATIKDVYLKSDNGRYGDTIEYSWHTRFPEPLTRQSAGIFAQWHGRPDRTLLRDSDGGLHLLTVAEMVAFMRRYEFDPDTHEAIHKKTGVKTGWKVDGSAGGPIGAFKIGAGYMYLLVRNNPTFFSDNTVKVKPQPGLGLPNEEHADDKSAALIFERPIEDVPINTWIHFRVRIQYSIYDPNTREPMAPGRVQVWIDDERVTDWHGHIGKNDLHGPYFKFGIYKPGPDGFKVDQSGYRFEVIEEGNHRRPPFRRHSFSYPVTKPREE